MVATHGSTSFTSSYFIPWDPGMGHIGKFSASDIFILGAKSLTLRSYSPMCRWLIAALDHLGTYQKCTVPIG